MCVVPPVAFVWSALQIQAANFSPPTKSRERQICLLAMNDNCNEIEHCSVMMMMVNGHPKIIIVVEFLD